MDNCVQEVAAARQRCEGKLFGDVHLVDEGDGPRPRKRAKVVTASLGQVCYNFIVYFYMLLQISFVNRGYRHQVFVKTPLHDVFSQVSLNQFSMNRCTGTKICENTTSTSQQVSSNYFSASRCTGTS